MSPKNLDEAIQAAGNPVKRLRVVERNAVKFAARKTIEVIPRLARREALINSAVGS